MEAIKLLSAFSMIEGYLIQSKKTAERDELFEVADEQLKLLAEKLK